MGLNAPDSSSEFSQPVQEALSKTQKAVLDRVIGILEHDPKLNAALTEKFQRNFQEIVSDTEKFNTLLEKIWKVEMEKLWEIEKKFNDWEVTDSIAKEESKKIIEHYTTMKLSTLKWNIQSA